MSLGCCAVLLPQVLCAANTGRQFLLHELLLCLHKELAGSITPATAATASHGQAAEATTGAADVAVTAAADAQRNAKLVAFLLLVQHLSGLYKTEQQRFRQGLSATLRSSAAAAEDDAGTAASASAPKSKARKQASSSSSSSQQLQPVDGSSSHAQTAAAQDAAAAGPGDLQSNPGGAAFDYMLGEEERQWLEDSTAQFTTGLLEETAPACYLPLLLQLLAGAEVPTHVKVGCRDHPAAVAVLEIYGNPECPSLVTDVFGKASALNGHAGQNVRRFHSARVRVARPNRLGSKAIT